MVVAKPFATLIKRSEKQVCLDDLCQERVGIFCARHRGGKRCIECVEERSLEEKAAPRRRLTIQDLLRQECGQPAGVAL